jgi:hypothetical protein
MQRIGRRAFLKRLMGAGLFGGVLLGSSEVAYLLRQATWQRAERTRLVLTGTVVTFQPDAPVIEHGAIYLDEQGRIAAVQSAREPAPPDYGTVPRVETGGMIYPGLIDLHNHPYYDLHGLWTPQRVKIDLRFIVLSPSLESRASCLRSPLHAIVSTGFTHPLTDAAEKRIRVPVKVTFPVPGAQVSHWCDTLETSFFWLPLSPLRTSLVTGKPCSSRVLDLYPGCHTCTVLSLLAEAMRVPSGDQATAFTISE